MWTDKKHDSSQLVNHPLHLLYRKRVVSAANLDYIRDELFYEKGLINLTPSRVLKLTGTQSNVSASGPSNASVLESHIRSPFQSALEEMMSQLTSADWSLFRQHEPIRMAPLYDWINVLNVVRKLSGLQAQSSTVELVWAIATSTTSAQRGCRFGLDYFYNIQQTHYQELLILLCQCTFTVTDAKLREERLNHLSQFFWKPSAKQNVQIEKAVQFLSTNTLEKIIRLLQTEEAWRLEHELSCPAPLASEVLKDQLGCKSLQDLCVLTILEAVRGDARKVWSLEQLPEPVKQLFHIPFQETYEELKARE